jgi:hypothetical protein
VKNQKKKSLQYCLSFFPKGFTRILMTIFLRLFYLNILEIGICHCMFIFNIIYCMLPDTFILKLLFASPFVFICLFFNITTLFIDHFSRQICMFRLCGLVISSESTFYYSKMDVNDTYTCFIVKNPQLYIG